MQPPSAALIVAPRLNSIPIAAAVSKNVFTRFSSSSGVRATNSTTYRSTDGIMPAAPNVGAITMRPPAATCSLVAIAQQDSQSIAGKFVRRGGTGMISCWKEPRIVGTRDDERVLIEGTYPPDALDDEAMAAAEDGDSCESSGTLMVSEDPRICPRRRGPMYSPRISRLYSFGARRFICREPGNTSCSLNTPARIPSSITFHMLIIFSSISSGVYQVSSFSYTICAIVRLCFLVSARSCDMVRKGKRGSLGAFCSDESILDGEGSAGCDNAMLDSVPSRRPPSTSSRVIDL